MDSELFHKTIDSYMTTLQDLKDYVQTLENSSSISYNTGDWKFDLETLESDVLPEFVTVLYCPVPKFQKKKKCSRCDNDRLIELNDSDFFNHYKVCECFGTTARYEVAEVPIVSVYKNGSIYFYECYQDSNRILINCDKVLERFNDADLTLPTSSVYYKSLEDCTLYVDIMNGEKNE